MNRRRIPSAPSDLRCALVVASILAASCAGDEFTSTGTGTGGGSTTSAASTSAPSSSGSNTTTSGEGGSLASTSSGAGGSSGSGGGGGAIDPVGDCDPELSGDVPIPDDCGLFVDPNLDEGTIGAGTSDDPFRSIRTALIAAASRDDRRIYIRAGIVEEPVSIAVEGVRVHGGLRSDWSWDGEQRTIIQRPPSIAAVAPLTVGPSAQEVLLTDITVIDGERDAGESSIAVVVLRAELQLRRFTAVSSDGMDGAEGSTPNTEIGNTRDPDPSLMGVAGEAHVSGTEGKGGVGGQNAREGCESAGGSGGDGGEAVDGAIIQRPGEDGTVGMPGNTAFGAGAPVGGTCSGGDDGIDGTPGPDGANALGKGGFTMSGIFVPPVASTGTRGLVGRGGGGGGGDASIDLGNAGDGGNGGSAGGCGGFPGTPGESATSSFAVVAIESHVRFDEAVTLLSGSGGDGGDGGSGQVGAFGGPQLVATSTTGCSGGAGGRGGQGGWGGAGAGGHSIGLALVDSSFTGRAAIIVDEPGVAGAVVPDEATTRDGSAEQSSQFELLPDR